MGVQSRGSACYGFCALYRKAIPVLGLARVFDFVAYNYFLASKDCSLFSIWSEKSTLIGSLFFKASMVRCSRLVIFYFKEKFCVSAHHFRDVYFKSVLKTLSIK